MAPRRTSISANPGERLGVETGFTLVELLVVIGVLGVLAAIAVFGLQNVGSSATEAGCQSDFSTTSDAVAAYRVEMGGYPDGEGDGSVVVTDSDLGTAPGFVVGESPGGVNAARPGGELLSAGNAGPNQGPSGVGPWLKESPDGSSSYSIWVANDGSGAVQVLDAAGHVAGASQSVADCATVTSTGGTTTTTDVGTTTTTSATTTTIDQAPAFTSNASVTFRRGVYGSFTVNASGSPRPSITVKGKLPSGLTFDSTTGLLSGTPTKLGSSNPTFTASNGVNPDATQKLKVTVASG